MFYHDLLPPVFNQIFLYNASFHNYDTRFSQNIHLPLLKCAVSRKTIKYTGPKLWNEMPLEIRQSPTLKSFKRRYRDYLLKA